MNTENSPHRDRLWTPWRMRYITGGPAEKGCIFCNRLDRDDDIGSLILHRADHSFIMMNLFPYNTAHLMIVPNAHVAEIEHIEPDVLAEMACLLPAIARAVRRVLNCDGFNIGFNQGAIAGAGVAEHLHQHVVPRWQGDANFMPILAGTMVIPELIPSTYAKLRAEFDAELQSAARFEIVLLDRVDEHSVWLHDTGIPTVEAPQGTAVWRAAVEQGKLEDAEVVAYSGGTSTHDRAAPPGLAIRTSTIPKGPGWRKVPLFLNHDHDGLSQPVRNTMVRVRNSMAPWIDSAGG